MARRLAGELLIGDREELIERLEHHDLSAEPPPDAAELESDDAGTDHAQLLRHRSELERVPGIEDALVIEAAVMGSSVGTEPLASTTWRAVSSLRRAIVRRHLDAPARQQPRAPEDRGHSGGLEQRADAPGHRAHDARAPLLHRREVNRDPPRV